MLYLFTNFVFTIQMDKLMKHPIRPYTFYKNKYGSGLFILFSGPGEVRDWDIGHIINGYALIFEEEFLSSFFKDSLFVQHLSYFQLQKTTSDQAAINIFFRSELSSRTLSPDTKNSGRTSRVAILCPVPSSSNVFLR